MFGFASLMIQNAPAGPAPDPVPVPLGGSVQVFGGSSYFDTNQASGNSYALTGRFFGVNIGGGTPPYTVKFYRGNSAAKTSLDYEGQIRTDTGSPMSWSGFNVGDVFSVTAGAIIRDSAGGYCDTGVTAVIGVRRVS